MVDAMPGCAWGWLRPSRAAVSRAAQAGGLGKREAGEPPPCLSHQPGVHRCGINHLAAQADRVQVLLKDLVRAADQVLDVVVLRVEVAPGERVGAA